MKTAIVYLSKHGTTEKVARMIRERLSSDTVTMIDLSKDEAPDLEQYERIVIGTSVYAGKVRKAFAKFCTDTNVSLFATRELGLFVCGMEPNPEKQHEELENAFPERMKRHAKVKAFMGGEFLLDEMNFLERFVIKRIVKTSVSISNIDIKAIDNFAEKLKKPVKSDPVIMQDDMGEEPDRTFF